MLALPGDGQGIFHGGQGLRSLADREQSFGERSEKFGIAHQPAVLGPRFQSAAQQLYSIVMSALQDEQLPLQAGRPARPESYSLARDELEERRYRLIGSGDIMRHQRNGAHGVPQRVSDRELVLLTLRLLEAFRGQGSALGDLSLEQQHAG